MRMSQAPNATPQSTPPSSRGSQGEAGSQAGDEQYVWTTLVPRLIQPTKLAIIRALIEAGKPLSIEDLTSYFPAIDCQPDLVERHVRGTLDVGTLEIISAQSEAGIEVPLIYFPTQRVGR